MRNFSIKNFTKYHTRRFKYKFKHLKVNRFQALLAFFWFIIFILWIRLFYLQIIKHDEYYNLLISQHYNISSLEPERGNIFIEDENGKAIQLTENINLYELYADPYIIWDDRKVADLLTPILYKHFCVRYKLNKVNKLECIENVEKFSWKKLLKEKYDNKLLTWDLINTKLDNESKDLSYITTWNIETVIKEKLLSLLKKSYITKAYIWFFDNEKVIEKLKSKNIAWLTILNNNYVYVDLNKIYDKDATITKLYNVLNTIDKKYTIAFLERILNKRPKRYVKITDWVNPIWIDEIKKIKEKLKNNKKNKVPLLHGIWYKKQPFRFYPYSTFLSHVIWYINWKHWIGWIEWYYDDILRWKEWKIIWMDTPWIWKITSSSLEMKKAENWADIYLTIDYSLQKTVEQIIKKYYYTLKSDNVSVVIMDPYNWQIKAMASYPNFDPNYWKNIYKIKPLTEKEKYLVDPEIWKTYIDIPMLIETGWKLKIAKFDERFDPKLKKYIFKNLLWPRTFINQNIAEPYEPWSIFKVLTEAIAIDTDDISLYDYYLDKWKIKVWPYKISNVAKECKWYHTYLHALEWSCNVWMVKIISKVWKNIYYNYLKQLWFGKKTGIQLDWEEGWKISALEHFSKARFFNNSFWQWILVTPIQMAVAISATVNGWYLLKPTIVKKIVKKNDYVINFKKYIVDKVFSTKISKDIIYALYSTIYNWDLKNLAIKWYTIWWKTWTSQLTFRWKYQKSVWWTNGSFVWIVTKDNLKYVIVVKVSRPRTCQRWLCTAWIIFKDIAKYIIKYKWIEK